MDLSTTEAAAQLGVSPQRVRALIKEGRIPTRRVGKMGHIIASDDLERLTFRRGGWPEGVPRISPKGPKAK